MLGTPNFPAIRGDRVAIRTAELAITYDELDDRVRAVADRLGSERRLVLIGAENAVEPLVAYLAALRGRHPVLLAPGGSAVRRLAAVYDPDVVLVADEGWNLDERRAGSKHALHPDLALLLTTSGSTGSSKVVRLSHRNLQANAESIGRYLGLTPDDRAITTLPMPYCYGLSVINSHLHHGAGIVLTDRSVLDPDLWDLFRASDATSFAGVPHTFALLDRIGFASMSLPTLRYVTQAGGRLHADQVRRYAALGRRDGWQLFVMYGQTEATARMAYLPPSLSLSHPQAIGVAIPGGSLTVEPVAGSVPDHGDGVGELVYRGPNVMLGYAENVADLAVGSTTDVLHTGDLGRVTADGVYELVGRRSRFVKLYGVRIDLDHLERLLAERDVASMCTGDDDGRLIVAVAGGTDAGMVQRLVIAELGLPPSRVCVVAMHELPRLDSGKPDYSELQRRSACDAPPLDAASPRSTGVADVDVERAIRAAFVEILGREPGDDDSFADLRGDSLCHVEMSLRLEEILGSLPRDWHTTPVTELVGARGRRLVLAGTETNVLLRAVGILLVVGTHAGLWHLPGGAHTLLGIAGYNFARFQLRANTTPATIVRVALPSVCWIAGVAAFTDDYGWPQALLLNGELGADGAAWGYWYIEALIKILVPLALILAIPAVGRFERRAPFACAMAVASVGLLIRFDVVDVGAARYRTARPHELLWLFALGWAAGRATSVGRRLVVTAVAVVSVSGFFEDASIETIVTGGLLLIAWVPTVPVPRPTNRLVGSIASASLYIYLTHWQVYPPLLRHHGSAVAVAGSVLVGMVLWRVGRWLTVSIEVALRRAASRRRAPSPADIGAPPGERVPAI